jgi:ABC-type uncharacterized transport system ATPase subunit
MENSLPQSPPALECRDVTVRYGDVVALSGVGVAFEEGRIHAVVGQNGAGKTTFARVASGLVRPQSGEVSVRGRAVATGHVREARLAGVELVHQSFALPPSFTVAEAMEFGAQGHSGLFSRAGLRRRWKPHLEALGIEVDPRRRIRDLPVETQQSVEIARALVTDAKVLILDEPTAVLSPAGIETLFARVRRLKANGVTVILILHKIREVLAVADTVTVLRGGRRVAGPLPCAEVGPAALAQLIIGTEAAQALDRADAQAMLGEGGEVAADERANATSSRAPLLRLEGVSTRPDPEGPALEDLSLAIQPGEIVGIAGVEGNGQRTLVRAIADLAEIRSGTIEIDGHAVTQVSLAERRGRGLRIIPFERNVEGLSLSSSLWENWSARGLLQAGLLKPISPARWRRASDAALKAWDVRYATTTQRAGSLSGGNAQKVILAREMDPDARIIVAAQPTRGLDIGATAFVWASLRDARARGCGVLLISSDLDELFDISDRVIVLTSGRIAGRFQRPFSRAAVGAAMTGAQL